MKVIKHINRHNQEQVAEVQTVLEFLKKYRKLPRLDQDVIDRYTNEFNEGGECVLSRHASTLNEITVLLP